MSFKTKASFGRFFTEEEDAERQRRLAAAVAAGTTDGTFEQLWDFKIRTWTTREAAQEWLDWANSLVPGPISSELIEE